MEERYLAAKQEYDKAKAQLGERGGTSPMLSRGLPLVFDPANAMDPVLNPVPDDESGKASPQETEEGKLAPASELVELEVRFAVDDETEEDGPLPVGVETEAAET